VSAPESRVDGAWIDPARGRTIPFRAYFPAAAGPAPTVVVSHATGGSREGYAYLGLAAAEHGYVSVHLQHPGSDVDCWRGKAGAALPAMRAAAADPRNASERVADLIFALDRLAGGEAPFTGRVDAARIGVCGHSFGAATALSAAGQRYLGATGEEGGRADPRIKAVLAMSSPRVWSERPEELGRALTAVRVPCLHLTGTRDDSPLNDTRAAHRRVPFDLLRGADQVLVTFAGGDHMVFVGAKRLFGGEGHDARIHAAVRRAALAFWDAYLRDDEEARRWLLEGGLAEALGGEGRVEARAG
jgi:predicted dienelactone hydrolase